MFFRLSLPEPHVRLMGCQESPAGRTAMTVQLTIFRHCNPEAITASLLITVTGEMVESLNQGKKKL